mgnify:CR=1 FL=1
MGTKTTTHPVVISALGHGKKETENYFGKILGNFRISELKKVISLELLAYVLQRTLSIK